MYTFLCLYGTAIPKTDTALVCREVGPNTKRAPNEDPCTPNPKHLHPKPRQEWKELYRDAFETFDQNKDGMRLWPRSV